MSYMKGKKNFIWIAKRPAKQTAKSIIDFLFMLIKFGEKVQKKGCANSKIILTKMSLEREGVTVLVEDFRLDI